MKNRKYCIILEKKNCDKQKIALKIIPQIVIYCMSKKYWPILYGKLLYKIVHYFLDRQYVEWYNIIYWAFHILPQIYTENHATVPIQIDEVTVQVCGNFWGTQYLSRRLRPNCFESPGFDISVESENWFQGKAEEGGIGA